MGNRETIKKGIFLLPVLMMLCAFLPSVNVQAATGTKVLYVGETHGESLSYKHVKSVKSSNTKVATVSRSATGLGFNVKAKKPGTTTITIRYYLASDKNKIKKMTMKFTVKKLDIKITAQNLDGGYVMFKVKNNTPQVFDKITFSYTLKDKNGKKLVSSSNGFVTRIPAKSTAYDSVYIGKNYKVDCTKAVFSLTGAERDCDYTYQNASSDDFTETLTTEEVTDDTISLQIKWENKVSRSLRGVDYIFLYDADNNIIGLDRWSFGVGWDTEKTSWPIKVSISKADHPTYDHYKIVTRAYTYARKN